MATTCSAQTTNDVVVGIGSRDEELRQVPGCPDRAEEDARGRQAEPIGEAGQRVAAPADLFTGLEWRGEGDRQRNEVERVSAESAGHAPMMKRCSTAALSFTSTTYDHGEDVPFRGDIGDEDAREQRAHAVPPGLPRRQREGDDAGSVCAEQHEGVPWRRARRNRGRDGNEQDPHEPRRSARKKRSATRATRESCSALLYTLTE